MNRQANIQYGLVEVLEDVLLFLLAWQWLPLFAGALKQLLLFLYDLVFF
jgi:hypothetical protein